MQWGQKKGATREKIRGFFGGFLLACLMMMVVCGFVVVDYAAGESGFGQHQPLFLVESPSQDSPSEILGEAVVAEGNISVPIREKNPWYLLLPTSWRFTQQVSSMAYAYLQEERN